MYTSEHTNISVCIHKSKSMNGYHLSPPHSYKMANNAFEHQQKLNDVSSGSSFTNQVEMEQ